VAGGVPSVTIALPGSHQGFALLVGQSTYFVPWWRPTPAIIPWLLHKPVKNPGDLFQPGAEYSITL